MRELISFPACVESLREYSSMAELADSCGRLGCDGLETIWGGEDSWRQLSDGLTVGYHLLFYADWLDFWMGKKAALIRKFGSCAGSRTFYGGDGREALLTQYRADFARAAALHTKYVVFHVSDVSIEECYTYHWEHSDMTVIDAAAELINAVVGTGEPPFTVLVENQWWPGFRFTDPTLTERLLSLISCENKGILLDTGHLMNTNPSLRTQEEGAKYILHRLEQHGSLTKCIRAVHLHQSLSGEYVRSHIGTVPSGLPTEYLARFAESYGHVLKLDQHMPWTDPCVSKVVERIAPEFLVHELSSRCRADRETAIREQRRALG